jgi:prepilin-type processing-associated H-X9-DG protein
MITRSHPPISESARTHSNQDPQASAGFSRVDLLTLIVVLVLLGLLLSPALARTRVTDQTLQCRNNLRQLIHGWRMYADANTDKLPNCFDWVAGGMNFNANNQANTNTNYLVNGLLGPYVRDPAVYKCPADQSQAMEGGVRFPRVRTISMSQAFCAQNEGHLEDTKPHYYRHYLRSADMTRPAPSNLWVLGDESPDSVNDASMAVLMDPYGAVWQDIPSVLHNGGCGFAFADGHYEIKKWTDPRTITQLKVRYQPATYGVYQKDNNDIKWIQERTTYPISGEYP